jgi:TolA-binding protein
MKARSREINIFNMSLLDILCGALGAFCFMMLVLFPYYSQDKGQGKRPDVQEGVDPKTFEEAKARIAQLEQTLQKFQEYTDQMEARLKRLEAQSRQQQGDMQQMQQRAERAEMRNPIIAVGTFAGVQGDEQVQVYIESDRVHVDKTPGEKVDASKRQGPQFAGDAEASGVGSMMGYYLVRDTPAGDYRVYAKIIKMNPGHTVTGWVAVTGNDSFEDLAIKADKGPAVIPVAVVSVDGDYKMKIKPVVPAANQNK